MQGCVGCCHGWQHFFAYYRLSFLARATNNTTAELGITEFVLYWPHICIYEVHMGNLREPGTLTSLQQRIATALLLLPMAGLVLWIGGWVLAIALALAALQMNREWERIAPKGIGWRVAGVFYIALPCLSLLILRNLEFVKSAEAALTATLYPLALVIATDTGAYFSGRALGGPKLAPKISPKKTWSGLLGGMACSAWVAILMLPIVPWPESKLHAALLGAGVALLGQAGDLFESWMKRQSGVKDSGSLLPGHGGLLDRFDGYVFVLPCYLLLVLAQAEILS